MDICPIREATVAAGWRRFTPEFKMQTWRIKIALLSAGAAHFHLRNRAQTTGSDGRGGTIMVLSNRGSHRRRKPANRNADRSRHRHTPEPLPFLRMARLSHVSSQGFGPTGDKHMRGCVRC